ncbi:HsdR family type I site-specific deoxyribonuclease [Paenibacillus sp. SYP-B3998]|uniref:Type I restriction enzyme endonuclease subunit n=1 Tax=Paenibacillus sp. SYP-B3998 TaxID=2678564 RepID=A0A6G3ZXU3_9BACL|nr:HsdR family type I site-specific deoxyribonuclease [Paenibacillus sp. SYP-B3998]NEW06868.1 HsdR family type I site-specific deoxyribonuclease [Paenibacillus sp. SYP-B3998]
MSIEWNNEKNDFNEKQTIDSVAAEFIRLGYEVFDGVKEDFGVASRLGRINSSEVILKRYLRDSIKQLNPTEDEDIIEQAINQIIECGSDTRIVFKNLVLYNYIKHGILVKSNKQGKEIYKLVKVVDWEHAGNNRFTIVTKFYLTNKQNDRSVDLLGFVNGIPLIFIETKNYIGRPVDDGQEIIDFFIGKLPSRLFWYNAFIIFFNGVQSFIGCVSDASSNLFEYNKSKNGLTSLLALIKKVCAKDNLLDRLENFITYIKVNDSYKKQIARNHHIQAVNNAYNAVNEVEKNKGRLGVLQQTQGSGRTQTILFFIQKIFRKMPGKWSFVIVTDRIEHDENLFQAFEMASIAANVRAQSYAHLRKLLRANNDVIFTTIQKFRVSNDTSSVLSERRNIIVLVYEANTSQYGEYATSMRMAIPNAAFMGLTGYIENKQELEGIFGGYLSTYNFGQSVVDGMAVPIYYEGRQLSIHINNDIRYASLNDISLGIKKSEREGLNRWLGSDYRQDIIAKDIVSHFMSRKFMGKAMVVSNDLNISSLVYEKVKRYWNKYIDNLQNEIALSDPEKVEENKVKLLYMQETEMCIVSSHNNKENNGKLEYRFKDPDDTMRLAFVCSMWITGIDAPNLDTIYIDKIVKNRFFIQISSQVTRTFKGKMFGTIVDYVGLDNNVLEEASNYLLFEDNGTVQQILTLNTEETASTFEQAAINELEDVLTKLDGYIYEGSYAKGRECLFRIIAIDGKKGKQLAEELKFLFNLEGSLVQDEESWNKYKSQIEWKCRVWRILSESCTSSIDYINENNNKNSEQIENVHEESEHVEEVPTIKHELKPVEKGALLENSVLELLEKFFDICEESRKEIMEKIKLRRQKSGTQFGFDIDFTYRNKAYEIVECVIECKYFERDVKLDDIIPKLEQLRVTKRKIEHWILISPNRNIDNYLNNILPIWEEEGRWGTIKNVQVWTPDNFVHEFFGIVPEVYDVFYPIGYAEQPRDWSEEKKLRIITKWGKMLQPTITLPKEWKDYLRNPNKILLASEADSGTSRDYSSLFENYVEMNCQDESGSFIEGTLEEYLRRWLDDKNSFTKILLGDFGDGKTFFTYAFSRNLINEYVVAPEVGWIPVRFALQDLGEKGTSQDFIERRLKNFGVSLDSWNEIKMNYRVLVILDGFDEMSLSINNLSVQENIRRLADCYKAFKGMKVLITSRKIFFNNKVKRDLLLQRIGGPEIIQIASISKYDRINHLDKCTKTSEERQRLRILKETNDIIGLASKPLFLNMVKTTLHNGKIVALDNVSIYEEYIANSFERKFLEQLECDEAIVSKEIILKNLRDILECLALTLQEIGLDSISINEFKDFSGKEDMAKYLWDISNTREHVEEDASERISFRSLLKSVSINENKIQTVAFCHRSMREYFVARGVCRLLLDDINKSESFLKKCDISYEIVIFTSQYIKKYYKKEQMDLSIQNIKKLIQKTKGKSEDVQRDEYARLGSNCVNILYQVIMELPGDDWSELLLDNANLSGANLSGKNFTYTSLRYANLDNADFSNADFRFCDLTGVRIEETHPIKALAVPEEADRIFVAYSDGVVRDWKVNGTNVITIAQHASKSDTKLFALPQNNFSIFQDSEMLFQTKQEERFQVQARFKLKQGIKFLKVGKDSMLILLNNENIQENDLQLINIELQKIVFYTSVSPYAVCEHLGFEAFVIYDVLNGLRLVSCTQKLQNIVQFPEVNNVTCIAVSYVNEKSYIIAIGQKDGTIQLWEACNKKEKWDVELLGKNNFNNSYIREMKFVNYDMIAISGLDGVIYLAEIREYSQIRVKNEFKLKISCKNMKVEGLLQESERAILEELIKNQK